MVLAGAAAGLYLAQGLILAAHGLRPAPLSLEAAARAQGLPYDSRPGLAVLRELRGKGRTAAAHAGAAYVTAQDGLPIPGGRLMPVAGVSRSDVPQCNEFGSWVVFRSDEHGFNNPSGLYRPGPEAVLIGDSFAEGGCVPRELTIAGRMRRKWPSTLSFGTGGVGPLVELAELAEYAAPLKPKRVFWLYYASDPDDLRRERRAPQLARYLEPGYSQRLLERQGVIDAAWKLYLAQAEASAGSGAAAPSAGLRLGPALRAGRFLSLYYLRAFLLGAYPLDAADRENLAVFRKILARARDLTRSWGGELFFVYLPERTFFLEPRRADRFRAPLLEAARAEGLPVIDGLEVFRSQPDPLSFFYLRQSTHYDAAGYRTVAEALLAAPDSRTGRR